MCHMIDKTRVLHIKKRLDMDGAALIELNIAKELNEKLLFDWYVEEAKDPIKKSFENLGSTIYVVTCHKKRFVRKVYRLIHNYKFYKQSNYKIIYFDTDSPLVSQELIAAYLAGIKHIIVHAHGTGLEKKQNNLKVKLCRRIMRTISPQMIACSEEAAKWVFPEKLQKKVNVIYNAIDAEKYRFNPIKRTEIRKKFNIESRLVVGHVGRFSEIKNQRFLIELLNMAIKRYGDIVLMLVGDGETRSLIKGYAQKSGVGSSVLFVDQTQSPEELYSAMDLFVLPSKSEGFPLTALEAQASGLPCIFSRGVPEIVKVSEDADFLALDLDIWFEKIEKSMKKMNSIVNRENAWKSVACSEFDIRKMTKEVLNIYNRME